MASDNIRLRSPLSPAECAARLLAAIDPEPSVLGSWSNTSLSRPVIGSVRGSVLRLRKRTDLYRNSFQTHLSAELRPVGEGTLVVGHAGMHPFVRVFMALWFTFLALIAGVMVLMLTLGHAADAPPAKNEGGWWMLLILPGLLVFGVGLVKFGRYLARTEGNFLEEFLARTLDAETAADT